MRFRVILLSDPTTPVSFEQFAATVAYANELLAPAAIQLVEPEHRVLTDPLRASNSNYGDFSPFDLTAAEASLNAADRSFAGRYPMLRAALLEQAIVVVATTSADSGLHGQLIGNFPHVDEMGVENRGRFLFMNPSRWSALTFVHEVGHYFGMLLDIFEKKTIERKTLTLINCLHLICRTSSHIQ